MDYENASSSSIGDESGKSTPQEHRSFTDFAKDKLDSAGRELRRRLPIAGHLGTHLIHPRRLLLNSAVNEHCDVVITFTKGVPDTSLLWLLQKLRSCQPGLRVFVRQHASTQSSAFYVSADDDLLLQTAEEVHLTKMLKPEFGGGYKEFMVRDTHCFLNSEAVSSLFNSMERAKLVRHVIETARASAEDSEAIPSVKFRPHQSIVPACIGSGIIKAMFPLHDMKTLQRLRKKWVKTVLQPQPLDEISEYFGVKIALYFAWLGHYTTSLAVPSVVGVFFWIWLKTANDDWKDIAHVLFSLFNVLWACVYLETWKRYSNVLAYKWGTLDQRDDLLMEPRPLFQGEMRVSEVTGKPETWYPAWKRRVWRNAFSIPLTALCLAISTVTTYTLLTTQDWWERRIYYFSWIPRAVLGLIIFLEEESYARLARWLNDKENYRLETKYENHLIVKIALFQFVNSFMSLFHIAFYLNDMDKLKEQLAVLLITRQIIGNLKESALPYIIENMRLAKICFDVFGAMSPSKVPTMEELSSSFDKRRESTPDRCSSGDDDRRQSMEQHLINQAELESQLFQYDGTFTEYLEMLTQLGHVVLFSSSFPLAAFCALVNNTLEIRADAFKMCHVARRPFGMAVNSIGGWQHAMEAMVFVAVVVNCALIGQSGIVHRMFPELSDSKTILVIVAFEHVVLIMLLWLRLAVPAVPGWLATEMAKVEYQRREAIKHTHSGLLVTGISDEELSASRTSVITPSTKVCNRVISATATDTSALKTERRRLLTPIGKISEIPPFRPKAASITDTVATTISTSSIANLKDASPTKPPHKEGAVMSALGVRGLRADEPLHRSAHCLPQQPVTQSPMHRPAIHKELIASSVVAGSEPDLNISPAPSSGTSGEATHSSNEDDKRKGVSRARAALVKRARSVAVFSLRLKKAREAAAAKESNTNSPDNKPPPPPPAVYGGELSLIPIEKLIQMDDVNKP